MSQWIENPYVPGEWVEFSDDASNEDIDAAFPDPKAAPEVPQLNIPTDWTQDPRAQAEAASAVEAVSPAPAPAGTTGEKRGSLLPISRGFTVDEQGQKQFSGDWDFAVPGILADVPAQVDTLASHRLGTEYSDEDIGSILSLSGFGTGSNIGAVAGAGGRLAESLLARQPKFNTGGIMDELVNNIKTRSATEKTPKSQIFREEALAIKDKYGKYMTPSVERSIDQIVQRGAGPIRSRVESMAARKGLGLGFDPGSLMLSGSSLAALGPGTGAKVTATRAGLGALDKVGILGAREIRRRMLNKDITDLSEALPFSGKGPARRSGAGPVEATRNAFRGSEGTAPRTGRPPTAQEAAETTPLPYIPPEQPTGPLSVSGYGGSNVTFPKPAPTVTATPKPVEPIVPNAQPVETPKSVLSAPAVESPGSKTLTVKSRPEQQIVKDYVEGGGPIKKPEPKPAKTGIEVKAKEPKPKVEPKSVVTTPKTGRVATLEERLEAAQREHMAANYIDDAGRRATQMKYFAEEIAALEKAIAKVKEPKAPKGPLAKESQPKAPAKKAAERQARKAKKDPVRAEKARSETAIEAAMKRAEEETAAAAAKAANKEKMRAILAAKSKRGKGSY